MNEIADILADAREYIEKHGWIQGALITENGEVCARGAIIASQGWLNCLSADRHDQVNLAEEAILKAAYQGRTVLVSVVHWNDRPHMTKQKVLDTFAKAEKIERAGYDPDAP